MTAAGGAIGLLAGEGRLPEVLARAVRARGRRLVCVQIGGGNPALEALADVFCRLSLGEGVVKAARPRQAPRFDVPTVGPETMESMEAVRARVLAIEARRMIVLEGPRLVAAAEAARVSVLARVAAPGAAGISVRAGAAPPLGTAGVGA